jgi:hypothetical protein
MRINKVRKLDALNPGPWTYAEWMFTDKPGVFGLIGVKISYFKSYFIFFLGI